MKNDLQLGDLQIIGGAPLPDDERRDLLREVDLKIAQVASSWPTR